MMGRRLLRRGAPFYYRTVGGLSLVAGLFFLAWGIAILPGGRWSSATFALVFAPMAVTLLGLAGLAFYLARRSRPYG